MDSCRLLCLLAVVLVPLLLVWRAYCYKNSHKLPPSPPRLPLIGHLHLLGPLPHHSLHQLSRKYGPVMLLWLGTTPTLIVSSVQAAKEVLKTYDSVFFSKPYSLVGEYVVYKYQDLAFAPAGDHYKNLRKLLAQFFSPRRIESLLSLRTRELACMINRVREASQTKQTLTIRMFISDLTFSTITPILFGKAFFRPDGTAAVEFAEDYRKIVDELVDFAIKFNLSEFVPSALRWIDWNIPRAKKLQHKLDSFLQKIVDERVINKKYAQNSDPDNLLDELLNSYEGAENRDQVVKSVLLELSSAGSDTSATAIEWALAELMHHSEAMEKLQTEIDKVVGKDRMVTESDLPNLSYLSAVVKENFRLHSPVKLVSRFSTRACTILGYHIPANTVTYVSIHSTGLDPDAWHDSAHFLPERFQPGNKQNVELKGQDFELLPFGSGRRTCLGIPLAMKTVPLVVANLVHGFEWKFPHGKQQQHNMEDHFGAVTSMAKPMRAVLTPRLCEEAYGRV